MAIGQTVHGDLLVLGQTRSTGGYAGFGRSSITQEDLTAHPIPLTQLRTWDGLATNLPAAGGTDDLGLITGTLGTDIPSVQTGDLKAAGATTRYARVQIPLPAEYVAGEDVRIRCAAGMKTTIADVSATIDVQAYSSDRDGTGSADLVTTAAQSINNLTAADKDFVVTPTALTPGMLLDLRIAIAVNDAATVTAVIGVLWQLELVCDRKG